MHSRSYLYPVAGLLAASCILFFGSNCSPKSSRGGGTVRTDQAPPPVTRNRKTKPGQQARQAPSASEPTAGAPMMTEDADEFASGVSDGEGGPRHNTESYDRITENRFQDPRTSPLSTFSIDVDTASYSNTRRFLNNGRLPPPGAVRIEELVNYFSYSYPEPRNAPFSITTETAPAPWKPQHRLVHIGLKGKSIADEQLPPRNLVFLLDVSGSMNEPNKLPLLKKAFRLLVGQLDAKDSVAIVVYAGSSGQVLAPTTGDKSREILAALERLEAGGSTNGGEGIELAYKLAREHFRKEGINRVILATDGDFNVGTTNRSELVRMIEKERASGVFLTVLGFGSGNYKDATMEELADKGNGNYAYIDNILEARKVLVKEAGATLVTIARDVKLQLEFNPRLVQAYRLIGYENRMLRAEDFNDDTKDAGEIGAGHTVTALYEIVPTGIPFQFEGGGVDKLKYRKPAASASANNDELLTIKFRYKAPRGIARSKLLTRVVRDNRNHGGEASPASENFRFSAAVAAFGMLLRDSKHRGEADYKLVRQLAKTSRGQDPNGHRAEFLRLVEMAEAMRD